MPEETLITNEYLGTPRIIVPTVRTLIDQGEQLTIKVIVLDTEDAKGGKLYWRPMGQGKYKNIELSHVNRSFYKVTLPEIKNRGIEI